MIHVSIDDYLDGLLSDTAEPSKKAIMKLTKLIENFGEIMVKSTERMEDYIDTLTNRINAIEHALGGSSRAPAPSAEPSFDSPVAAPAAAAAPDLTASNSSPVAAPNLSATVGTPDLSGGGNPEPSGSQGTTGNGISSADIMKAASNLQKAPEPTPGDPGAPGAAPVFSPFGVSATDIQDVRSGLTKVDPDEHRKERAAAAGGTEGSMPASMALNLEVKDALSKRKSRTDEGEDAEFEPTPAAPASPQKSTKQMKEALQGELRDAFSSLLESDTKED
ncbi:MAG: hypothetical protein H7644_08390 [Candidatus Heimdallarchaeota archaeon]|nr:hypothetical protein [Candidatus Heimdallarchaeota archaeon]MCK5143771.1 hypothetical protein [Candidatus Heimdallarchaeota archaeon]